MTSSRAVSCKSFLSKSNTKAANSSAAFIQAYREFLETGELAVVTSPILARLDAKDILPTPALEEIRQVIFQHLILSDIRKATKSLEKTHSRSTTKPYQATVYNALGEIQVKANSEGEEKEMIANFEHPQEAVRYSDNRLVNDCSPDCFGVVIHSSLPYSETVLRIDSFRRLMPKNKSPFMKVTSPAGGMKSLMRVRESRTTVSRG